MGLRPFGATGLRPLGGGLAPLGVPGLRPLGVPALGGLTAATLYEQRARKKSAEEEFRSKIEEEEAESFLGKLSRTFSGPHYAILNLLRGRPVAGLKNLADTVAGVLTLDPVTGLGSRLASREEQPFVTDVMKSWGMRAPKSKVLSGAINIGGGLLTDPLTYLTFGGSALAKPMSIARGIGLKRAPRLYGDLSTALSTTGSGRARWAKALDDAASDLSGPGVGAPRSSWANYRKPAGLIEAPGGPWAARFKPMADRLKERGLYAQALERRAARKVMADVGGGLDDAGFAARHGLKTDDLAKMTPRDRLYMDTLKALESGGEIAAPGIYADPWILRWPLRKMGLISEDSMNRTLLSRAGGFFDDTIAGQFTGGPAGKMLAKGTIPGMLWGGLGKVAPDVQMWLGGIPRAAVRAVWNPTFGILGKNVPRGLRHMLESLDSSVREGQYITAQNFRERLIHQLKDFDKETMASLSALLPAHFSKVIKGSGTKMDVIIDAALEDLVHAYRGGLMDEALELVPGYKSQVPKPGIPPVEREGLFIPDDLIDLAGPGRGRTREEGLARIMKDLQGEVNKKLSVEFETVADAVINKAKLKKGWTQKQIVEIKKKLVEAQEYIHGHHQNMLAEAQDQWRMLPTYVIDEGVETVILPTEASQPWGSMFKLGVDSDGGIRVGRLNFNFYLPRQMSDEYAQLISQSRGTPHGSGVSSSMSSAFEKFRKTGNDADFVAAIEQSAKNAGIDISTIKGDPKMTDIYELMMRRFHAHNSAQWNKHFVTEAAKLGGRVPPGMTAQWRKIVDARERLDGLLAEANRGVSIGRVGGKSMDDVIAQARKAVEEAEGFAPGDLKAIKSINDVDWGQHQNLEAFMRASMKGLGKRGEYGQFWDKINMWMKQSMTIGIGGVPFLAFSARNLVGGMVQALMDPSTNAADAVRPMWALMHDFPLTRWITTPFVSTKVKQISEFKEALASPPLRTRLPNETIEQAMARLIKAGGDDAKGALALQRLEKSGARFAGLSPSEMVDEISKGGIVGKDYAATELFKRQMMEPGDFRRARRSVIGGSREAWDAKDVGNYLKAYITSNAVPRKIASAVEDTMRLNTYLSMRSKGISAAEAARRTNLMHINYRIQSNVDRNLRAVFPFLRFRVGTAPVVLEQALTRPRTVTPLLKGMDAMRAKDGELVPKWLEKQMALPLGLDKEGNMMFLTQFGLIHEDVNSMLSGFGDIKAAVTGKGFTPADWIQKGVLASMHPFLKGILQYGTGRDFWFGTEIGDYVTAPKWMTLMPQMEDTLIKTGLLKKRTTKAGKDYYEVPRWYHPMMGVTPLNRLGREFGKLLDDRQDWWVRVVESGTGIKIASVDQNRELKRELADWLKDQVRAGDLGKLEIFFSKGELPPEAAALLKLHNDLIHGRDPTARAAKAAKEAEVKPGTSSGPPEPPKDQRPSHGWKLGPSPVSGR